MAFKIIQLKIENLNLARNKKANQEVNLYQFQNLNKETNQKNHLILNKI